MSVIRTSNDQRLILVVALLALAGCATRPVNPRIARVDTGAGYRFETRNLPRLLA